MARLTIEQVAAPDLTQASEILARAGVSFNDGMNAAKDLLGKYQEGQMAKNDAAILNDIAKLDSEEALNVYLNSDALVGKRFSPKMTETILGLRDGVLGYAQDRATTTSTIDSNNRANAVEGRQAAEYAYGVKARDEANALTPLVIAANQEGMTYGRGGVADEREILARTIQAEAGGEGADGMLATGAVIRNRVASGKYGGTTLTDVIMAPGQFSAWNGVTGYAGGEGALDMDNIKVSPEAYAAADAVISGNYQDPTGGATHYYNPNVATPAWGSDKNDGGATGWLDIGNHRFGSPDGGAAPAVSGPITTNSTGGPAAVALAEAIKGSLYLSPDQALKLLQTGYDAQTTGQGLIDAAEAKRVQTLSDEATVAAITDPGNLTAGAVARDLIDTPGLSAGARLAIAGQNLDAYGNVIAPSVAPQSNVDAALARAAETDASNGMVDPQAQAFAMVDTFTKSENIGDTLLETAGLTGDALKESGLDSKYVGQKVKEIANKAGVTEAQAAAALAQIDAEGTPLKEIITGNSGLMEQIIPQISRTYGPEAQDEFRRKQAEQDARTAEREAAKLELDATRSALVKMPDGPQKEAAQARIQVLTETILGGTTPQQLQTKLEDYVVKTGMASRLQGLDPGSAEFFRAMSQLEEAIKTDSTLSETEKGLLIQALRG